MIKVKRSKFGEVDLVFLLMKSVRKSLLFLIISGNWFATSAAVLFFAGSKCAPA